MSQPYEIWPVGYAVTTRKLFVRSFVVRLPSPFPCLPFRCLPSSGLIRALYNNSCLIIDLKINYGYENPLFLYIYPTSIPIIQHRWKTSYHICLIWPSVLHPNHQSSTTQRGSACAEPRIRNTRASQSHLIHIPFQSARNQSFLHATVIKSRSAINEAFICLRVWKGAVLLLRYLVRNLMGDRRLGARASKFWCCVSGGDIVLTADGYVLMIIEGLQCVR